MLIIYHSVIILAPCFDDSLHNKFRVRYDRFFPRIDTVFWSRLIVDWSCPRYLFLINTCVVNIVYSGYGNIDSAREAGFEQVFWIFTWNISMNGWMAGKLFLSPASTHLWYFASISFEEPLRQTFCKIWVGTSSSGPRSPRCKTGRPLRIVAGQGAGQEQRN